MSKTILVAEDDAFLGETISLGLQEHGTNVILAVNGEEAIHAIEKKKPDLLLLDLIMPKKDGFAVMQHIQSKAYTFPVIILSNLSGDMDPEKCFALGAKDYFVKSDMDEDELWPKIQRYL